MRDVPDGIAAGIVLHEPPEGRAKLQLRVLPPGPMRVVEVAEDQFEKAVEVVILDDERSVHVAFADRKFRVDHHMPDCCAVRKGHACLRTLAVAEREHLPTWQLDR